MTPSRATRGLWGRIWVETRHPRYLASHIQDGDGVRHLVPFRTVEAIDGHAPLRRGQVVQIGAEQLEDEHGALTERWRCRASDKELPSERS